MNEIIEGQKNQIKKLEDSISQLKVQYDNSDKELFMGSPEPRTPLQRETSKINGANRKALRRHSDARFRRKMPSPTA